MFSPLLMAALLVTAAPAVAQSADRTGQSITATVEAIANIRSASSPSFSPDGKRIAYISNAGGTSQIWIAPVAGGEGRQVTNLTDPVQSAHWSPTGEWIAFDVASDGGASIQTYISKPDGSGAKRLTPGGKNISELDGWSSDGRYVLAGSNANFAAGRDPWLINVRTGSVSPLATGKGLNKIFDVSRDGRRAVVGRKIQRGDGNFYLVDLQTGSEALLTPHEDAADFPWGQFSPDGRRIYLISNAGRDTFAFAHIELDAAGQPGPIRITAERADAEAARGVLSPNGRRLLMVWNAGGRSELEWLDTRTHQRTPGPVLPVDVILSGVFSRDGRSLAFSGSGANAPTGIYTADVNSSRVKQIARSVHDGVDLGSLVRPTFVTYKAHDGVSLSGWLYRPAGAVGPGPLVLHFRNHPDGQSQPQMNSFIQGLVARGITVFAPNVRGSSGFGKRFMHLDNGAKRVDAIRDIKSTAEHLVAAGIADPQRLGIFGTSYGGYMVLSALTEFPDLFAAGASVSAFASFETFFKNAAPLVASALRMEYGDPETDAEMLKSLSPIHKLERVKTPLLILHGAKDTRVQASEAEQMVIDLKRGNVPVEYLLFPDEGHFWPTKPANRVRAATAVVEFFTQKLD